MNLHRHLILNKSWLIRSESSWITPTHLYNPSSIFFLSIGYISFWSMAFKATLPLEKKIWHVSEFREHYRRIILYIFVELRHYFFQKSQNRNWISLRNTAICHRDSVKRIVIREDLFFILYLNNLLFWMYKSNVSFLPSVQETVINLSLL